MSTQGQRDYRGEKKRLKERKEEARRVSQRLTDSQSAAYYRPLIDDEDAVVYDHQDAADDPMVLDTAGDVVPPEVHLQPHAPAPPLQPTGRDHDDDSQDLSIESSEDDNGPGGSPRFNCSLVLDHRLSFRFQLISFVFPIRFHRF